MKIKKWCCQFPFPILLIVHSYDKRWSRVALTSNFFGEYQKNKPYDHFYILINEDLIGGKGKNYKSFIRTENFVKKITT